MRGKRLLILTMSVLLLSACSFMGIGSKKEDEAATIFKIPYTMIDGDPKEFVTHFEETMDYEFDLQVDVLKKDDDSITVKMYKESEEGISDAYPAGDNVEFTFPNYLTEIFIASSMEEVAELLEEMAADHDYYIDGTINPDDSITFRMDRDEHEDFMAFLQDDLTEMLDVSYADFIHNEPFTKFTFSEDVGYYEREELLGVTLFIMVYHAFSGMDMHKLKLEVEMKNEDSGKIFDSIQIPKDLEDVLAEFNALMEYEDY